MHSGLPSPPAGWRPAAFDECVSEVPLRRRPSIPQHQYKPAGRFPVVDQGAGLVAGYTDDESAVYHDDLPLIVFGDHTRAFKFLDFPFATGADGTKLLRANDDLVDSRFLYFALLHLPLANRGYNRHFRYLREHKLLVPREKTEQREIAHVLRTTQTAAERQARIVGKLKELKAATAAKLFREGLRGEPLKQTQIGPLPTTWDVKTIGDSCAIRTGGVPFRDLPGALTSAGLTRVLALKVSDLARAGDDLILRSAAFEFSASAAFVDRSAIPPYSIVFPKRGAAIATNKKRMTSLPDCTRS